MMNMQMDEILSMLYDKAKEIGEEKSESVSAERFIVAVIDFLSAGKTKSDEERRQRAKLKEVLERYFPFTEKSFSALKEDFLIRIHERKTKEYLDSLYMQQRIKKAKETALKQGKLMIWAELLLLSILDEPNDYLKSYLENHGAEIKKSNDTTAETTGRLRETSRSKNKQESQTTSSGDGSSKAVDELKQSTPREEIADLTQKIKQIHRFLSETVLGQENAVQAFTTGYFQAELLSMTDKNRTRPRATFLFAGPPGVGKTFLAEKAAECLGLPFMRFDMSEYGDKEASIEFIGSDAVYKDSKQGNFTSFVSKNPKSVILFDEIEKAHISIIHLFLQILDAGRIRDSKTDQELSLTDTIMIFTTNAGRQLYETAETGDFSNVPRKAILKALQNDINPETKRPFFPAAICSRFSSGNVVMFNQVSAQNLRQIAKREMQRHAVSFEQKIGIKTSIDERVYTALLFAEGGAADARAVRSRAEMFFDGELYELFRLMSSERYKNAIQKIESIDITVDLTGCEDEISNLFEDKDDPRVMIISSKQVLERCMNQAPKVIFLHASNLAKTKRIINDYDLSFVLIDLSYGMSGKTQYLNREDVSSTSRDLFWYIREYNTNMPVYILQGEKNELDDEEKSSFLRQGVQGFLSVSDNDELFQNTIMNICDMVHQQKSMDFLAKSNKMLTFETAQYICDRGKRAVISLFDFESSLAVDPADSESVLSRFSKPDIRFEQVIGAEDAKKELKYFVEYLKNPKKLLQTGVMI